MGLSANTVVGNAWFLKSNCIKLGGTSSEAPRLHNRNCLKGKEIGEEIRRQIIYCISDSLPMSEGERTGCAICHSAVCEVFFFNCVHLRQQEREVMDGWEQRKGKRQRKTLAHQWPTPWPPSRQAKSLNEILIRQYWKAFAGCQIRTLLLPACLYYCTKEKVPFPLTPPILQSLEVH